MSQQPPPNKQEFIPPPPPVSDSPYSPEVLANAAATASKDARNALIMGIVGIFCLGLILGILAYQKANQAIETIDNYGVAQDKRGLATAAKVIGIIDIVGWAIGIASRIFL
jgi:hypothetical protein